MKLVILILTIALFQLHAAPLKIIVDSGHGGRDSGAVHGKVRESDINLAIGRKLIAKLKEDPRFQVISTRKADKYVSLERRAKASYDKPADLFVSLHANSAPDKRAHGAEFYIRNQLPAEEENLRRAHHQNLSNKEDADPLVLHHHDNPEINGILEDIHQSHNISLSWKLANSMQKNWTSNRSREKSIRQAPFYLLNKSAIPAVLVEMGFLTHSRDLKRLLSPTFQRRIVADLHRALLEYKELMDNSNSPALQSTDAK